MRVHVCRRRGFTLVEVSITMAILGIALVSVIPITGRFLSEQNTTILAEDVLHTLRTAKNRAASGYAGSAWGVEFEFDSYTLFSGSSFAEREQEYDATFLLSENHTITSTNPVLFSSPYGEATTGSIVTISGNGNSIQIIVRSTGSMELSDS